jgi:hypothetical protein
MQETPVVDDALLGSNVICHRGWLLNLFCRMKTAIVKNFGPAPASIDSLLPENHVTVKAVTVKYVWQMFNISWLLSNKTFLVVSIL